MRLAAAGLCASMLMSAAHAAGIEGFWHGEAGSQSLEIEITAAAGGGLQARVRGLNSGIDLPASASLDGTQFKMSVPAIEMSVNAAFDGDEIEGQLTRGNTAFDIELERAAPRAPAERPQDPKAPLPYAVEEVTINGTAGGLAATLTRPEGTGTYPAVVLVTQDGPQDRNGQAYAHRPSLVLADALTRAGYAVLRYDDRGVGASGGAYTQATTVDFGADAAAALAWLRARSDIDPARIAVIGRGNGASVAAIGGRDAAALVLISAPVLLGADGLNAATERQMRENGDDEEEIAERIALQTKAFAVAADPSKTEADIRATIEKLIDEAAGLMSFAVPDDVVDQMARQMSAPWFRHYLSYDPKSDYARAGGRVLFLYGAKDTANPPGDSAAAAVAAVTGGKAETVTLDGLNAALATFDPDKKASVYDRAETVNPAAIEHIVSWLRSAMPAT